MAVDLLAFINDDNFEVQDGGTPPSLANPVPDPEPDPDPEPTPEPDPEPIPDPSPNPDPDPTPEPTDTPEPGDDPEPTPQPEDAPQIDLEATYKFMSEMNLIEVPEEFEFDGTPESAETAISYTLENMRKSAQSSLLETLPPDFQQAVTYALAKGQQANLNDYLKEASAVATDIYDDIDLSSRDNQRFVVKEYLKQTTQHSDQKINKYISLLEENETLATEAKENVSELLNIRASKQAERNAAYKQAIEQREETRRELRKKFESIIDSANYIDSPRKNKVKAFINNQRQVKGKSPYTGFEKTISQIQQNEEHLVQLADILESSYNPESGFDYDRLKRQKASEGASNIRQKLDKFLAQPQSGKATGPVSSGFN